MSSANDKDEKPAGRDQEPIDKDIERRLTMINNRLDSRDLFVGTHEIANTN